MVYAKITMKTCHISPKHCITKLYVHKNKASCTTTTHSHPAFDHTPISNVLGYPLKSVR